MLNLSPNPHWDFPPMSYEPQPMPEREGTAPSEQIANPMEYIPAPEATPRFKEITEAATGMYETILENCPRSAERTIAIRKLQEARMWANAAIAFDGRTYPL